MKCGGIILIIKAGTKLTSLAETEGDFEHWIMSAMGREQREFEVVSVAVGQELPDLAGIRAVVITGSAAMVTDKSEWIEKTAAWLRAMSIKPVPVLGICFGHQLLAYALGGEVADNPEGIEVGTVKLHLSRVALNDPLFSGMQDMLVQTSHRQVVRRLPVKGECLATTAMDDFHAFRYGDNLWGIQFHPEFSAAITRKYIEHYQNDLLTAGVQPEQKLEACQETMLAYKILARFSKLAGD